MPEKASFYIPSLSARTVVYKGMLNRDQLPQFYPDLRDDRVESALALVHSRFSTNTFPSWPRAHPYRLVAHNGEINTLRGNVNWMHARESMFESTLFGDDLTKCIPVIDTDGSDSGMFDNVLELLVLAGRSLPHAMMMMIPEPWSNHESMSQERKDFYEFHGCLMEPWDGPASVAFTDGIRIGATLDRNGLRPSRYYVTKDDLVVMASEVGVLDIPPERILREGPPAAGAHVPGRHRRRAGSSATTRSSSEMAAAAPYGAVAEGEPGRRSATCPSAADGDRARSRDRAAPPGDVRLHAPRTSRCWSAPMANDGVEAIGSMGTDTPLAVLSNRPQLLYNYFKQLFAQVTNPPVDAIREEIIMAVDTAIGPEGNLLEPTPESARQIELPTPGAAQRGAGEAAPPGRQRRLARVQEHHAADAVRGRRRAATGLASGHRGAARGGQQGDRRRLQHPHPVGPRPRRGARADPGAAGDRGGAAPPAARRVAHARRPGGRDAASRARCTTSRCCSATAPAPSTRTWPSRACTTWPPGHAARGDDRARRPSEKYVKAVGKGIVKVCSKMGISTIQSYHGAQVFEAIGLNAGVHRRVLHLDGVAHRRHRHRRDRRARSRSATTRAFPERPLPSDSLDPGGQYQYRRNGEFHLFNPVTIHKLQHACRTGDYGVFKEYSRLIDDQSKTLATLRGLMELKSDRPPVPLDEVEPVEAILKRFKTGAMSYGSISKRGARDAGDRDEPHRRQEQHRRGRRGSGALRPATPTATRGAARSSRSRRGASASTATTWSTPTRSRSRWPRAPSRARAASSPGRRSIPWIAKVRYSTPGVGLISPPPHHDIYSIEDLAQLIHDLKNANPRARISVKLVAEVGVGTIAAGVAKAHADLVLISGHDGGTGASPLTSIKHAGIPWELGLAETHQVLVLNNLRSRIVVETDGQLKTGPRRRRRGAAGRRGVRLLDGAAGGGRLHHDARLPPQHLPGRAWRRRTRSCARSSRAARSTRSTSCASSPQEVRELMAQLGFRTVNEMVGRTELHRDEAGRRPLEGEGARLLEDPLPARRRRRGRALPDRGAGPRARRRRWT